MGKITDIAFQKKNKNRMSIFIDDAFVCGLEAITVKRNRLEIGDEITEEELKRIQAESESGIAFERAVKLCSGRSRTKREIKRYLLDKGYTSEVVNSVMKKLAEYGFTDDFRFCREYVAAYSKRVGLKKIKFDLKRLGAEDEAISAALEEVNDQEDEAFAAAEKYIRTHRNFVIAKLKSHLYSRGFSMSDINAAVDRISDVYETDGDDDYD